MKRALIEACVESLLSAQLADSAGVDRLELCSELRVGGVTPNLELVRETLRACRPPVVVLVRHRPGDFCYDSMERCAMVRSAQKLREIGVQGLAVGAIRGGQWDLAFMSQVAKHYKSVEMVAHRAIDVLLGPQPVGVDRLRQVIQPLIDLGYRRILTSGGYGDVVQGAENIRRMIEYADGRIEVLPGGGVSPENAQFILQFTGAQQLHGSFQRLSRDPLGPVEVDSERLGQLFSRHFSVV